MQHFMRRFVKSSKGIFVGVMAVTLCIMLAGCGSKVEGKYVAEGGVMSIDFHGGKATMTTDMMGTKDIETCDYTVDGDKVLLKEGKGKDSVPAELTIMKDGSLQGGGITFKKAE